MIALSDVSARTTIRNARVVLDRVTLESGERGVLGVLGADPDGTSLLFDVLDGTTKPKKGRVVVLGGNPAAARTRIARVSIDAPLPEELTVEEVVRLETEIRGAEPQSAKERLSPLGIELLAPRRVGSLSVGERRAVSLGLALSSSANLLLVEEPLAAIEPVATRLVVDAIRQRAKTAMIVVTTASPRDAMRLSDRIGVLTKGTYASLQPGSADAGGSVRIVVAPSSGKAGAAAIAGDLSAREGVSRVEVSAFASSDAVSVFVSGSDMAHVAKAVTRAVATAGVEVQLVETSALSLDALRAASPGADAVRPPASPISSVAAALPAPSASKDEAT